MNLVPTSSASRDQNYSISTLVKVNVQYVKYSREHEVHRRVLSFLMNWIVYVQREEAILVEEELVKELLISY